jgi:hypothetical protein
MRKENARYVANRSSALQARVSKLIKEGQAFLNTAGSSRLRTPEFCFCVRRGCHSFSVKRRWLWRTLLETNETGIFSYADRDFAHLWIQAEVAIRSFIESADIEVEVLGEML